MNSKIIRHNLPDYPYGWFAVCYSTDLQPEQILQRRLFGKELVIFRTASGKPILVDAYCPHLGAHLGFGGKIVGELIRCPFHGLHFNEKGECTSFPKVNLNKWTLVERNGFIFTYFDSNTHSDKPRWELPILEEASYTKLKGGCEIIRGHPQDILENSVDFRHLNALHGFDFPHTAKVSKQDNILVIDSEIERHGHLFTRKRVRALYRTFILGMGLSYVDVKIPDQNMQLRLFGMVTPVDPGIIELRLAVQLRCIASSRAIHPLLSLFPKHWVEKFILGQAYKAYVTDVSKDFPIWQNKIYIQNPAPIPGNGPILKYREWARQFYAS